MEKIQRFKRRIPLDAGELEGAPKAKAKRCLFGAVNHDDLIKDLKKISEKLNSEANKRWNFDFAAESPLHGRFEWVKLDSDEAPSAYQMPRLTSCLSNGLKLNQRSRSQSPVVTEAPVAMATHGDKENVASSNRGRSQKIGSKRKASPLMRMTQKDKSIYRTQPKISDHFQQRKSTPKTEVRRKLDL